MCDVNEKQCLQNHYTAFLAWAEKFGSQLLVTKAIKSKDFEKWLFVDEKILTIQVVSVCKKNKYSCYSLTQNFWIKIWVVSTKF